ncbi:MAG: diguanylate cyclase, partial [Thermoleophilia bacterium]|nr:diguanylate cyclase [Thermoleophilia bacterium]
MANTTQDLKTDTTLEELRTAAPRDERELALAIGFAWWLASIVVLLVGSYALPPVMEHGLDYWRISGLIVSVALAVSYVTWMKRLPPAMAYRAIFGATLLAGLMNLPLMLAAPATVAALTINLLLGVMYAAYFLSGRQTVVVTALVTLYAMVPSIVHESGIDQRMTSRLTVWLPIVWLIAIAIRLQNHERRRAVASAEHQALTDPLTGIANLRAMRRRVADALELSHRAGRVAALLLIDLDGLKTINTRHGHTAGDNVLQNVANSLARSARPSELVARIGGDMFAVLIENVAVGEVAATMLRYRATATDAATDVSVPDLRLNAHVGVAIYPDDGIAFEQLM